VRFPTIVTAGQVADLVGGELIGQPNVELAGVASLEQAGPGDLTFLDSARFLGALRTTQASIVLVTPEFRDATGGPRTRIVIADPTRALVRLFERVAPVPPIRWGVHPTAHVGQGTRWNGRLALGHGAALGRNVRLGRDCVIAEHCVVHDDVELGDRCQLGSHVTLHRGARLGDRVIVHAGARIGGRGFGFVRRETGHEPSPQVGRCILGDDVEVGANSTIDRGGLDDTTVGAGTKIDNLVQIAHNVRVGARCIIMAQVGVAGSTVVEDGVMLAGQAGLADHLTVGSGARVAAQSGVIGDIPSGATVSGYPARNHRSVLRQTAALARLSSMVSSLERMLERDE
jgi:UDP-3-O-[3-hydroxymyristoyl] glucosamine N-acyltransferase